MSKRIQAFPLKKLKYRIIFIVIIFLRKNFTGIVLKAFKNNFGTCSGQSKEYHVLYNDAWTIT